jgi:hypothetical protein
MADSKVRMMLLSDEPVPFEADGETGERYRIEPGQTLGLRLARIAVSVLRRN